MELVSHSWNAQKPCILLKVGSLRVLLDCALGMDSMASFLPCPIVQSCRMAWQKKVHSYGKGAIPVLKQLQEQVYVELVPEVRTVLFRDLDIAEVDAILVSNSASLVGLPFLTEGTAFRGEVYATDPTVQLGKLVMQDLCDMFERIDRPAEDAWAWKQLCRQFPNAPTSDPAHWRAFYTRDAMDACLARVHRIFFREEIVINGELRISAFSSGHSIGSCNWLLRTEHHRIGYLAASSQRQSHTKPMELGSAFAQLDSLILSALSNVDQMPDKTLQKFNLTVAETLKRGGNVLVPVVPTGLVYDMFECILQIIEMHQLSRSIPIYFISSVAESSLQFAQIFPEWLHNDKSSRVYKPEEPFYHSEFVRSGRIRVYDSLHGAFARECRQPCVVFAGHPSLRIGEMVHLLDLWGGNSRNAIVMIDPDYPLETYYAPYKSLAIRAYYYPIETRLDHSQVLNKIIGECSPKRVLFAEEYGTQLSTLQALPMRICPFRQHEAVQLVDSDSAEDGENGGSSNGSGRKRVRFQTELLMRLSAGGEMQGFCPLSGLLSAYDNALELKSVHQSRKRRHDGEAEKEEGEEDGEEEVGLGRMKRHTKTEATMAPIQRFCGVVKSDALLEELKKRKLHVEKTADDGDDLYIADFSARVRLLQGGRRTLITCANAAHRREIQAAIQASFLTPLSSTTAHQAADAQPHVSSVD